MTKLHLGCGNKKIHGFINVDARKDIDPDLVDDIFKLNSVPHESVDLIYACHCLEHCSRHMYPEVLSRWYDILKVGGVLRVAVPDIEAIFSSYFYHRDLENLIGHIWGGQKNDYDYHHIGWDFESLKNSLKIAGFKNVYRYDWSKTEHWYIDDYSQAYYPHLDKTNGKLMSLNVEAIK